MVFRVLFRASIAGSEYLSIELGDLECWWQLRESAAIWAGRTERRRGAPRECETSPRPRGGQGQVGVRVKITPSAGGKSNSRGHNHLRPTLRQNYSATFCRTVSVRPNSFQAYSIGRSGTFFSGTFRRTLIICHNMHRRFGLFLWLWHECDRKIEHSPMRSLIYDQI